MLDKAEAQFPSLGEHCTSFTRATIAEFGVVMHLDTFMKQIREWNSSKLVMRLEGDQIRDWNSGTLQFRVDGDQIREWNSGKLVFRIDGNQIREWNSGRLVYRIE